MLSTSHAGSSLALSDDHRTNVVDYNDSSTYPKLLLLKSFAVVAVVVVGRTNFDYLNKLNTEISQGNI